MWASLGPQMVNTMQETQLQPPGREDPQEKGMTTHSNVLAWRISWKEEPGGLYIVHEIAKSWTQLGG